MIRVLNCNNFKGKINSEQAKNELYFQSHLTYSTNFIKFVRIKYREYLALKRIYYESIEGIVRTYFESRAVTTDESMQNACFVRSKIHYFFIPSGKKYL